MTAQQIEVAIVGGGIAGMSAAAQLVRAGHRVEVFEKSRGPGGRSSTRRQEELRFDHGIPYIEGLDKAFVQQLQDWQNQGWVERWPTQWATLGTKGELVTQEAKPWVAVPKMSALARAIGQGVNCHYTTRIESLEPKEGAWVLHCTQDQRFEARKVLLTPPPPQTLALLASHSPHLSEALTTVKVLPDWTLMLSGAPDLLPEGIGCLHFEGQGGLDRLIAEHRKPQRPASPTWTLHANAAWSREHEEKEPQWIREQLLALLSQTLGKPVSVQSANAHRWRYAHTEATLDQPCLADKKAGLFYAGDSCLQGSLESAYLSGQAVAQAISESFGS